MWNDLSYNWQEAFIMAWESFKNNTIPIGSVIVDEKDNIISRGRNQIFDEKSKNPLAGTYMAHAEMTAMALLKEKEHKNIRSYTLYTTMEPCPMCFGTMVMMGIRNVKYAARDGYAGATILNNKLDYIANKNIQINSEPDLEKFQICIQTAFECIRKHPRMDELLTNWSGYCKDGVELGKSLHKSGYFSNALMNNKSIEEIYNELILVISC
jgi:tRNA(adenine34) deaminase